ncbi:MAG: hypothetical protein SH856_07950 [Flavobacteriales bacterium]|nr:hypothetical protein [Flavobacteriales bacterium]
MIDFVKPKIFQVTNRIRDSLKPAAKDIFAPPFKNPRWQRADKVAHNFGTTFANAQNTHK